MRSVQKGFTLIELIVVIVILGILAAVALPRFIDLTQEALTASTQGVAGAISSAAAINYGAFQANSAKATQIINATPCATSAAGLLTGGLPTTGSVTYTVTGGGSCALPGAPAGTVVTCTVTGTKGSTSATATASLICTG